MDDELSSLDMQLIDLSQDLVNKKLQLEDVTRKGFFGMVQARNSMGRTAVSAVQIPAEAEANVKVKSEECNRKAGDYNGEVRFNYLSFVDESGKETKGVRNRKTIEDLTSHLNINEEKVAKKEDPLKWFGVLVPNSLKQSQICFQRALEYSVDCANIQNEINGVVARRKYLLRTRDKS